MSSVFSSWCCSCLRKLIKRRHGSFDPTMGKNKAGSWVDELPVNELQCVCKTAFISGALVVSSRIESFNSYHELTECSAKLHVIKWIVMILDTDWSIQSCWNTQHRDVYDAKQQLFTVATCRFFFKSLTLSLSNTTKNG